MTKITRLESEKVPFAHVTVGEKTALLCDFLRLSLAG